MRFETADSTNDAAAALAARGWPEGTLVLAGAQRAGRGRQGRPWHSPPGANLYCSVLLRPPRPLREWPELSWVVAAAVAQVARAHGAAAARIKHPNDVVADGRKIAGVLLETRSVGDAAGALVAGVGVNVNGGEGDFPGPLRASAVSLAQLTGARLDRDALLAALCGAIEGWYGLWCAGGAGAARRRMREQDLLPVGGDAAAAGALEAPATPAGRGDDDGAAGD